MKDINQQVLMTMQVLKNDSNILIEKPDYDAFHAYLEGYVDGLNMALSCNLRREITHFYESKGNIKTNYYWTNQIQHRNEGKTNSELIEILLDITEEYFLKNTNWYVKMDKNKIEEKLYFWFDGLKNRQGMYIAIRLSLSIYLEALIDGLNIYSDKNLRFEISRWFNQKTGQALTFHWTKQITDYYTGQCESINKKLSELAEEFFKTNKIF